MQKFISIYAVIVLTISITFFCCNNSSEPEEGGYEGITETDENGQFIGNIDFDDWSSSSYYYVYRSSNFWVFPIKKIIMNVDTIGHSIEHEIKIYNSGSDDLSFSTFINSPFLCNSELFTLQPNSLGYIELNYTRLDTLSYSDTLNIICNSKSEEIKIPVKASWSIIEPDISVPVVTSFYPAYPNPCSKNTTLSFSIPKSSSIKLYIRNKSGDKSIDVISEKCILLEPTK